MGARISIASLGALLALVLQIVLAPNIAILNAMPSFIISYAIVISLMLPQTPAYIMVFCLGLLGDLLGYGPVGALSFILLLTAFLINHAQEAFGNGTVFVTGIIVVAFVVITHFLHAAFMVAMSSSYSAAEAFRLIAIPQALYDCVLALLLYLLLRRIFTPENNKSPIASIGPLT